MKNAVLMIAVTFLAAASVFAECSDADKKALAAFDAAWTKAGQNGDKAALMAIYADEYVGFPTMQLKSQAVEATMATFERNKITPPTDKSSADHYMIACTPLTATVTHRNVTVRANGETVYGRSVHFLEKRNGNWVVVSNAGGPLSDSDVLRYMELDWIDAVKSRNYDWFEKNYATDFTEVSFVTGKVMSKRQAIDGMKNDKTVFDVMEVSDVSVRVDGNSGIVTGMGRGKGKDADGKPFDVTLRFTDTYIKRDGRWQAWASQATMIPDAKVARN